MATELISRELSMDAAPSVSSQRPDPSVREIIADARSAPAAARGALVVSGTTAALMWAGFTPLNWGPLGWMCLVPLLLLVRLERPTRRMYGCIYLGGLAFWVAALEWMRLGDPSMYLAWVALAVYLALYFPLFVALSRVAVHRLSLPLMLSVPLVWVGLEFVRAYLMTGFAWYNLSHTQYRWIELIQISDVTGAYGVSFVMALTSACLAELLPVALFRKLQLLPQSPPIGSERPTVEAGAEEIRQQLSYEIPPRRQRLQVAVCLLVFAAVLGYGYVRRSQAAFQIGPRVALIQGNFSTSLKHDPEEAPQIFRWHNRLTGMAVKHQPDLIIWPETMFPWPLMEYPRELTDEQLRELAPYIPPERWRDELVPDVLADMSQQSGAAMVIGIESLITDGRRLNHYNSALFIRPDMGINARYDKLHRVVFGEYIPLKEELPGLHRMTPFPEEYGIEKGAAPVVFDYRDWRFAPIICFEDTVPHLVRKIVRDGQADGNSVDCLVNLTNDGWFHGSRELDQHLITAAFRSVECRTPLVRAVNTGISAIIDGDGVVIEPDVVLDPDDQGRTSLSDPQSGRWYKDRSTVLVDSIPLDPRTSLYVAHGDWFACICGFSSVLFVFAGFMPRTKRRRQLLNGEASP